MARAAAVHRHPGRMMILVQSIIIPEFVNIANVGLINKFRSIRCMQRDPVRRT
jgi:hypothetical protein